MAAPKAVSVTTSATKIVAANPGRVKIEIQNLDDSEILYIGESGVTTAAGFKIAAAADTPAEIYTEERTLQNDTYFYTGAIYGIVASGTADIRVWEKEIVKNI